MDNCKIDTIYQATVNYPTTSGCTYQLATGKITPSTNITTFNYFNLNLSQTVGFVNFVPFKGDVFDAISGIGGQVHVVACGVDQGWQTFTLPLPSNYRLMSGYRYEYTVSLTNYGTKQAVGELTKTEKMPFAP